MKPVILCFMALMTLSCKREKLPFLGEPDTVLEMVDGIETEVLKYPKIPQYSFVNHEGKKFTEAEMEGKVYVADFFFTTCPTICPVMKSNMLTVFEHFKDNDVVRILSHTIDPDHDTPAVLNKYASDMKLTGDTWQFVTGNREDIYEICQKHYFVSAMEAPNQPGGLIHSGSFVLIDKNKYVRGIYDGTSKESTAKLIKDMEGLLEE